MFYLIDTAMDYIPQFDAVIAIISDVFSKIFSRFHWAALLSAVVLATLCWWTQGRTMPPQSRPGLLAWMFPRSIWLHRSALLDYRFVLFDKFMIAVLAAIGAMLFLQPGSDAEQFLSSAGGDYSLVILLTYTLTLLIVEDFCRYWAHRIMHMSPLLWQFHKVHHSPEVLVPFSQMRSHPVNGIVNLLRSGIAIGSVTGAFLLLFPGELTVLSIFGINAGRFVFDVMGSNLRHSHVWLSFGPRLSHIFISPAQHQIHHSRDPKHFNKNYGSQFALWDWMFGTLYVPRKLEKLRFGIDRDSTRRMQSVRALYIEPFRDAAAIFRRSRA